MAGAQQAHLAVQALADGAPNGAEHAAPLAILCVRALQCLQHAQRKIREGEGSHRLIRQPPRQAAA